MDEVLGLALQSMRIDMTRLEQAAMNMANAGTPAYRRGQVVQTAGEFASMVRAGAAAHGGPVASSVSDTRTGTLKHTGRALDFALDGEGFFEVATPAGVAYTRRGAFSTDARGRLVTAQGHAVLGAGGDIQLQPGAVSVSVSGAVTQPGQRDAAAVAALRIVRFPAGHRPLPLGDGLYAAAPGMTAAAPGDAGVRQGYLEGSNVSPAHEMTQLMLAMRHFESMQRAAQARDDMLATAIRKLGDNP